MVKRSEYELIFIAHPEQDEEEGVPALTAQVQEWIEAVGGEVTYTDIWGRRKLAYPIRKLLEGSYVLLRATLPRQTLQDLERELKLSDRILRYLLVRAETPLPAKRPSSPKPTPAVQPPVEAEPEPDAQPEPELETAPEPGEEPQEQPEEEPEEEPQEEPAEQPEQEPEEEPQERPEEEVGAEE
jgi:small subunit ribosomal protein S6